MFSLDDKRKNDNIVSETRNRLDEMKLQNYGEFTEFQKYLLDDINLKLTTLKESLRQMEHKKQ